MQAGGRGAMQPAYRAGFCRGPGLLGNAPAGFRANSLGNQNQPVRIEGNSSTVRQMMPNNNFQMPQQMQQQQQQQQQQTNVSNAVNNAGVNTPDINQMFNAARDTQLALVNTLLKGNLRAPLGNNLMTGMANEAARQANMNAPPNNMTLGNMTPNMTTNNMNMMTNKFVPNHRNSGMSALTPTRMQNSGHQMAPLAQQQRAPLTGSSSSNHGFQGNLLFQGPEAKRPRREAGVFSGRPTRWQSGTNGNHNSPVGQSVGSYSARRPERHSPHRQSHVTPHVHPGQDHSQEHRLHHDVRESYEKRSLSKLPGSRSKSEERGHGGCKLLRGIEWEGSPQEEYDPAQPTEEQPSSAGSALHGAAVKNSLQQPSGGPTTFTSYSHGQSSGQGRKRSHSPDPPQRVVHHQSEESDLRVTIQTTASQDSQGHSCDSSTGSSVMGIDILEGSLPGSGSGSKFYCHACSADCRNLQNFDQHMQSQRHKSRMSEIMNLHVQKTDQQLARLKAEEHLRRIEGRDKEDYCRVCDKKFYGSFINHRKSQEHKRKERLTRRGCKLCNTGNFSQYPEYVRHIDSEPHKKNQKVSQRPRCHLCNMTFRSPKKFVLHSYTENHKKKKAELRRQDVGSTEDGDEPESLEELVTLDATGIYNGDSDVEDQGMHSDDDVHPLQPAKPEIKGRHNGPADIKNVSVDLQDCSPPSPAAEVDRDMLKTGAPSGTESVMEQTPVSSGPLGESYLLPVSGLLCTLCGLFFQDETRARTLHCSSTHHCANYQGAVNQDVSQTAGDRRSHDDVVKAVATNQLCMKVTTNSCEESNADVVSASTGTELQSPACNTAGSSQNLSLEGFQTVNGNTCKFQHQEKVKRADSQQTL